MRKPGDLPASGSVRHETLAARDIPDRCFYCGSAMSDSVLVYDRRKCMKNRKTLIAVIIAVVLAAVLAVVYVFNKPKTAAGAKHVTVTIREEDGMENTWETDTEAEYLVQVLDELQKAGKLTYEAVDSDYGPYVTAMNNIVADYGVNGKYWAIYVNGEYGSYGIGEQPVTDGDVYTFAVE